MSNSKIVGLSSLALLLCLLTVPTLFLLLPVFLFPLIACLIGLYVYKRGLRGQTRNLAIRLFALLPLPGRCVHLYFLHAVDFAGLSGLSLQPCLFLTRSNYTDVSFKKLSLPLGSI